MSKLSRRILMLKLIDKSGLYSLWYWFGYNFCGLPGRSVSKLMIELPNPLSLWLKAHAKLNKSTIDEIIAIALNKYMDVKGGWKLTINK